MPSDPASTFSLPPLLGIPPTDGALLSHEQLRRVADHIRRCRPQDVQSHMLLGGSLGDLDGGTLVTGTRNSDPFLVLAGEQAALALLSHSEGTGVRCLILSDPDQVDLAAMTLIQLSNEALDLPERAAAEPQQAFVAALIATLISDETALGGIDLPALLPNENTWIALTQALLPYPDLPSLFNAAEVLQVLRSHAIERALLAQIAPASAEAHTLAAIGGDAPARLPLPDDMLKNLRANGRPAMVADNKLDEATRRWTGGKTLTVVPLLQQRTCWGLLLLTSPRPISSAARAQLNGLGVLITAAQQQQQRRTTTPRAATPPSAPSARSSTSSTSSGFVRDIAALFANLDEAAVLVDAQGMLVRATAPAMRLLNLAPNEQSSILTESSAACLAPLFSEALMSENSIEGTITLPNGTSSKVSVNSLGDALWVFILHESAPTRTAASAAPAPSVGEASDSFLHNFSWLVQTPLREIHRLITTKPAPDTANEQHARIIGQIARLNSEMALLVSDLLALGQVRLNAQAGHLPLRLDLLIEAIVGSRYAEFGRRGQNVTIDPMPGLPRVIGAETALSRVLDALIDNASKYSPRGARIRVSARHEGGQILITIEDTGYGLSAQEIKHVCEPFYRAASAQRAGTSGRGLGLTLAKAIVEEHGGELWIASHIDDGSIFSVRLPSSDAPPPNTPDATWEPKPDPLTELHKLLAQK
ncbi:MAG: sensor histidine kinase [Candidatus Viridilinea halotolerans]|uniref:histidine kinase n=1 Tax=Candidatus Viridilinea halotolerans TaxID=2491704 RepID=A0A426U4Z5_9CHLR|nr:MAG: sensor histidine kinase [Candidatus Viridilinea halotolerans]